MKKFQISASVVVSAYTVVYADSIKEAREIASGRDAVIGDARSGYSEEEFFIIEDADGIPQDLQAEEIG